MWLAQTVSSSARDPIGLLSLQMLLLNGAARVFIAEIDAARLAMGEALGGIPIQPAEADTVEAIMDATGDGVALSLDAVGSAVTRAQCVAATRPTGRLVLSGLHEETSAMPVADMIRREITAVGSFAYTAENFALALDLLGEGALRLDPWIVEAPLEDGGKWFRAPARRAGRCIKGAAEPELVALMMRPCGNRVDPRPIQNPIRRGVSPKRPLHSGTHRDDLASRPHVFCE